MADAVVWYRRAAEAGLVEAQFQLGLIYLHGQEAVSRPRRSAPLAANSPRGVMMSSHNQRWMPCFPMASGSPRDLNQALRWLRAAAEAGKAEAQVVLGDLARSGRGGTQDYGQARRWFECGRSERPGRRRIQSRRHLHKG